MLGGDGFLRLESKRNRGYGSDICSDVVAGDEIPHRTWSDQAVWIGRYDPPIVVRAVVEGTKFAVGA